MKHVSATITVHAEYKVYFVHEVSEKFYKLANEKFPEIIDKLENKDVECVYEEDIAQDDMELALGRDYYVNCSYDFYPGNKYGPMYKCTPDEIDNYVVDEYKILESTLYDAVFEMLSQISEELGEEMLDFEIEIYTHESGEFTHNEDDYYN